MDNTVEFNTSPAKDPNSYDRDLAKKVFSSDKLNHIYNFKREFDHYVSAKNYLEKHGADGVLQSTGSTASSLTLRFVIYTDTLSNLDDAD